MHLDRLLPDYDVHEVHSILVRANPLAVHRALFEVTSNEVWLFRTLMAVRGLGARGSDGSRPILERAQEDGFAILAEEPGRELVLGVMGRFWQLRQRAIRRIGSPADFVSFAEPGFARAAMNFLIEPLRRRRLPPHHRDPRARHRRPRAARLPRRTGRSCTRAARSSAACGCAR